MYGQTLRFGPSDGKVGVIYEQEEARGRRRVRQEWESECSQRKG